MKKTWAHAHRLAATIQFASGKTKRRMIRKLPKTLLKALARG